MAKQRPDYTFKRGGRSLKVWLQELVAEDAPTRRAAGEALQAMLYAVASVHTDLIEIDWGSPSALEGQSERFRDAIRSAVQSPGFDAHDFVRKLILYRMALQADWHRRVDEDFGRENAPNIYEERLLQRAQAADGDKERTEVLRRYLRWVCASFARDVKRSKDIYAGAESMTPPAFMAAMVFQSLDVALLADRPGLYAMLADKDTWMRDDAAKALARIGPAAVDFAPFFFAELDAEQSPHGFRNAHALGSIGRDDPDVIDGLLRRLRSASMAVRSGAAEALSCAGPPLAGRLEVALDLLLTASSIPELVYTAIPALASVGRNSEVALHRVLEVAKPRPPRWQTVPDFPDHKSDEVMGERGTAISSLHYFKRFADKVVPVLVDALDSFEEYDPDWSYGGEHGRVCHALESFGPLAAPAVPWIVRFLEQWPTRSEDDREWPNDLFRLLAAIGPAAADALPALEQLCAWQESEESPPAELDPDEPLDRAILILRQR